VTPSTSSVEWRRSGPGVTIKVLNQTLEQKWKAQEMHLKRILCNLGSFGILKLKMVLQICRHVDMSKYENLKKTYSNLLTGPEFNPSQFNV